MPLPNTSTRSARRQRGAARPLATWARRCVLTLGVLAGFSTTVGCFVPIYSARPERRVQQLLYTSEDMRSMIDTWERFWFLDAPSHMTPVRTHGGVL